MTRKIVVAAFAAVSLCISECRGSNASREGQPVSFTHKDAVEMDTSSAMCDEGARVFDAYLREELTNFGLFMIYDADNRSLANANVLCLACRHKPKDRQVSYAIFNGQKKQAMGRHYFLPIKAPSHTHPQHLRRRIGARVLSKELRALAELRRCCFKPVMIKDGGF